MRKWKKTCLVALLVVLLAALCCGGALALEEGKSGVKISAESTEIFQVDSLPEGFSKTTRFARMLGIYEDGGSALADEPAVSAELKYVSGASENEQLLSLEKNEDGTYNWVLSQDQAKEVGETTWHLSMESEHYFWEDDITLEVKTYSADLGYEQYLAEVTREVEVGIPQNAYQILSEGITFPNILTHIDFAKGKAAHFVNEDGSPVTGDEYPGLNFPDAETCVVEKNGIYHVFIEAFLSVNIKSVLSTMRVPVTITATNYSVQGPKEMKAGGTAQYYFSDPDVDVTWRVEGEGLTIDENGLLTAAEGLKSGNRYTVYAAMPGEEEELSKEGRIAGYSKLFSGANYSYYSTINGFKAGSPNGDVDAGTWSLGGQLVYDMNGNLMSENWPQAKLERDGEVIGRMNFDVMRWDLNYHEEPLVAQRLYDDIVESEESGGPLSGKDQLDDHGHPILLYTYEYNSNEGRISGGTIRYVRNYYLLTVTVYVLGSKTSVEMEDLIEYASTISFDDSELSDRADQVTPIIHSENDQTKLISGKTLKFTASFGDESLVNAKNKNNAIMWGVYIEETGEETPDAKMSDKGVLTANKNLTEPVVVTVFAISRTYTTSDKVKITLLPAVTRMTPSSESLAFYLGSEDTATISLSLEPENTEALNLEWKSSAPKVATVEANEDGTATVKAVGAGKANITVKEAGGKTAKISVSVLQPVESVELTTSGKAKAGGTVTVKAALSPKNVGDKTLEWSLDVDEDVATINKNGQVKISKTAEAGTKITVTCTATGAPEPVIATAEIVVE